MQSDSDEVRNHTLLSEFTALVDKTFEDGTPDFDTLSTSLFVQYWPHLIIHRYEEAVKDFRTIFYGTHIVDAYERDCTGLLMSEMGFGEAEDWVRKNNKQVLESQQRQYFTSSLFWKNKEHRVFHQVKMPLRRKGEINEVLVCMYFT